MQTRSTADFVSLDFVQQQIAAAHSRLHTSLVRLLNLPRQALLAS